MLTLQNHKKIHDLLCDWDQLAKLYETIQTGNNLTVQVNGCYRDEFRAGAVKEAKRVLKEKSQVMLEQLKNLGFDTSTLEPLREVVRPEDMANEPAKS
jgi:hypothetical protein